MTYTERVAFFREAFAGIPLADFDCPAAYSAFSKMTVLAVRLAGYDDNATANDEWSLAALEVLCEGSPAAREYFERTKEALS
jgi:hypothetical protein